MVKLIPNDLNTYPPCNEYILVHFKDKRVPFYVVYRDSYFYPDKFVEASGEQYTWWEPEEIDSWITLKELGEIL